MKELYPVLWAYQKANWVVSKQAFKEIAEVSLNSEKIRFNSNYFLNPFCSFIFTFPQNTTLVFLTDVNAVNQYQLQIWAGKGPLLWADHLLSLLHEETSMGFRPWLDVDIVYRIQALLDLWKVKLLCAIQSVLEFGAQYGDCLTNGK